jgi:hypothetical protein
MNASGDALNIEQSGGTGTAPVAITETTTLPGDHSRRGVLMHEGTYERIQGRIKKEVGRLAPSLWLAGAFAFLGIGGSALLAYLELPTHSSNLPAGAQAIIATIAIAAGVAFVLCVIGAVVMWDRGNQAANDICNEMDTHSMKFDDSAE